MFERKRITCLDVALNQVQNGEQTMEIKLPEGMPDVGQVLMAWGQPILRGKEWREDQVQFSGGMMVWVLYEPEDGGTAQCVQGWIPFQMRWELPENTREGTLRLRCLPRFVDGRNTSPRKILVRSGIAVLAEAFVPSELMTAKPKSLPEGVALLENTYPVRLLKEAGEKAFQLEEILQLPDSAPRIEQLICWQVSPRVTEQRILTDKAVMKGSANLHVLYRSDRGQLHCWDFDVPFSQYAELRKEYGSDARLEIGMVPTSLELERLENGGLDLKGGLTAQYLITAREPLTIVEDAYGTNRELTASREDLKITAVLENRKENIYGEQTISVCADLTADVQLLPDFPRQRRMDDSVELEYPGQIQVLCYGEDGRLHGTVSRWEGKQKIPLNANSHIWAVPQGAETQTMTGNGKIHTKIELPVELTAVTDQTLSMVTGLELGVEKQPDPNRPSLILQRTGNCRLWDIAKNAGTTVEAICRANGLEADPEPDRMLLIPVP